MKGKAMNKETENIIKEVFAFRAYSKNAAAAQEDAEKRSSAIKKKAELFAEGVGEDKRVLLAAVRYLDSIKNGDGLSQDARFADLFNELEEAGADTEAIDTEGSLDFCAEACAESAKEAGLDGLAARIENTFNGARELLFMDETGLSDFIREYNALITDIDALCKTADTGIKRLFWSGISRAAESVRDAETFIKLFRASFENNELEAEPDRDGYLFLCEDAWYPEKISFEDEASGKPVLDGLKIASINKFDLCGEAFSLIKDADAKERFLLSMPKINVLPEHLAGLLASGNAGILSTRFGDVFVWCGHGFSKGQSGDDGFLAADAVKEQSDEDWQIVQAMFHENVKLTDWSSPDTMRSYFDGLCDSACSKTQDERENILERYRSYVSNACWYTGDNTGQAETSRHYIEERELLHKQTGDGAENEQNS